MKTNPVLAVSSALLALSLVACGSDSGSDVESDVSAKEGRKFVKHVRNWIPSADTYDDESLIGMAENVCQLGNVDDGVRILDNYRDLESEDYKAFAISALEYACPSSG